MLLFGMSSIIGKGVNSGNGNLERKIIDMVKILWHTYKTIAILVIAYLVLSVSKGTLDDPSRGMGLAVFVGSFLFAILYAMFVFVPHKLYGWVFGSGKKEEKIDTHKEETMKDSNIDSFEDLLKRGKLPDDDREVPTWLKIKNDLFEDVDFSHNTVDDIITLPKALFLRFYFATSTGLFFTYMNTLSHEELERFYDYLLNEVVNMPDIDDVDAKTWFKEAIKLTQDEEISDSQKAQATLQLPLLIHSVKYSYLQAIDFKKFIQAKYYPYKEDDSALQYEGTLFQTIYSEEMKYIPDYFEQVFTHFRDYYDAENEEHQKIGTHLARRFGVLSNSLYVVQKATDEKHEGLVWFLQTFIEDIKTVDESDILEDDTLLLYITNTYASIILEDDASYIASLTDVTRELMQYYPYNSKSFLYALKELMKSVALKEMTVANANNFLSIFEELPRFYEVMSYEKVMELKEMINTSLANDKLQDNKVFEEEGVKNKMILLNYLVDMEDLYYASKVEARRQEKYTLFLTEYVKLFGTFKNEADLRNAGLWDHKVIIDATWNRFDSVIKDKSAGVIGWMSPVTADIFDMQMEMPVVFEKLNGEYLSVGVPLALVELKR